MHTINKSTQQFLKAFFITFSFLITSFSFGQSNSEDIDDIGKKPVYTNLSKALRNSDKVYKLNLSNKGLTEFPVEILKLKELRYLILDSNQITNIPSQINDLQKLKYLSLSNNTIQELPSSL